MPCEAYFLMLQNPEYSEKAGSLLLQLMPSVLAWASHQHRSHWLHERNCPSFPRTTTSAIVFWMNYIKLKYILRILTTTISSLRADCACASFSNEKPCTKITLAQGTNHWLFHDIIKHVIIWKEGTHLLFFYYWAAFASHRELRLTYFLSVVQVSPNAIKTRPRSDIAYVLRHKYNALLSSKEMLY